MDSAFVSIIGLFLEPIYYFILWLFFICSFIFIDQFGEPSILFLGFLDGQTLKALSVLPSETHFLLWHSPASTSTLPFLYEHT